MGPEFWKPDKPTKLKKCSERRTDSCDLTETDGCCGVVPCSYCLEWVPEEGPSEHGLATFDETQWIGNVAGAEFVAFWERGESGECEFVVELDGVEVYRNDCYGGQSCRDSSDSASATIGYDSGTLIWTKLEPRPLEYTEDPDAPGCKTWFCGECECSCDCLCVTIIHPDASRTLGEICDTSYPCDPPVWEGTVGDYDLSFALGRDVYGECVITPTVDGVELAPVSAGGCNSMSATITLEDETVINMRCKVCDCSIVEPVPCVCTVEPGAIWCGYLTSGTECASDVAARLATGVTPTDNQAWNDGDCIHVQSMRHLKNPFPGCMDPDNTKRVLWVQKRTDEDTPFIDNSIVQKWDWYIVVYENATDTILSIHYEYEMCCNNVNRQDDIDTFLAWVKVFDVTLGPGTYDMVLYNPVTAAEYGNCGYPEPECVFET